MNPYFYTISIEFKNGELTMKKSLKFKLLLSFSSLLLITCLIMSVLLYQSSMTLVKDSVGNQASRTVENAIKVIDLNQYNDLTISSSKTDYYFKLREELNQIRQLNNMEYLFTMSRVKKDSGYDYYYMVDGMPLDSEEASELGEKEENADSYPGMRRVFESGKVEFEITNDEDYGALISVFAPIKSETGEIIGVLGADIDATQVYQEMDANKSKVIMITAAILIIGLTYIYFLTTYLTKPLHRLTEHVKQVGNGDLTISIESNRQDEIGVLTRVFNQMVYDLKEVIHSIHSNSKQLSTTSNHLLNSSKKVSDASKHISTTVGEVSQGAYTQYRYSEDSAHTLEQIAQGIQQVAVASTSVSDLSSISLNNAENGNNSIQNVINQMNVINHSVQLSADSIKTLEVQSNEISSILNMIRDISSQTNMLALNAAIEAARAGAHGKGFAVVAEEVRKLAEQTDQSTNSISHLILNMNQNTSRTVESMNIVTKNVSDGIKIVEDAGTSFEGIANSIQSVSSKIKDISINLEEMSASSEELSARVEETTTFASQVADNTKQVAELTVEQESYIDNITETLLDVTKMTKDLDESIKKFIL